MEIFRDVKIDWLNKKWYFLGVSWALLLVGIAGYIVRGGFAFGIDFTGGTIILLKFANPPNLELIRGSLKPEAVGATVIQRYGEAADNSVLVRMQTVFGSEKSVDEGQRQVQRLLRQAFDPANVDRPNDFNNIGLVSLTDYLLSADPEGLRSQGKTSQEIQARYQAVAQSLLSFRDRERKGLVPSLDDLRGAEGVSPAVVDALKKTHYTGSFAVKGVESVGAIVGSDLRRRASLAVLLSFLGMLVYIGFRFKPIYGVAAIFALFHDVAITLGLFALTQLELSLTVVAALLTLVGYSVNDTIVVFDRVRENLRLQRKDPLPVILNASINQTLSRTIMVSGMTFLSVLALFVFGGEVLRGFSFALVVGIIIGTYSSIAIAAPIVDWWYRWSEKRTKR